MIKRRYLFINKEKHQDIVQILIVNLLKQNLNKLNGLQSTASVPQVVKMANFNRYKSGGVSNLKRCETYWNIQNILQYKKTKIFS